MNLRLVNLTTLILPALLCSGCGSDEPSQPTPPDIGASWRLVESGIVNTVRAIADNGAVLVAVGDGGIIYTSTDGNSWTRRREGGPNDGLMDIAWIDSVFVAVGMNGTLIKSPDGIDWTWIGIEDLSHLYAIAAGDTLALAVGTAGSVYTSTDGVDWQLNRLSGDINLYDLARLGNLWVAAGDGGRIFRSIDGLNWSQQTTTFGSEIVFPALTATDSLAYAVAFESGQSAPDRCRIFRSSNADTWFYQASLDAWYVHGLFWTGTELIAVGEGTNYHLGFPDGLLFSSTDGQEWLERSTDAPFSLTTAARFGNQLLVGGSGGYILTGTQSDDLTIVTSGAEMTGVVWTGSRYVAVTARGTVMQSANGDAWSERHSRMAIGFDRLAYSGSAYAALGGLGAPTDIYSSTDGVSWTRTLEFQDVILKDITWGGGQFVACGQDGAVFTSESGDSWTRHFVGDSTTLRCIIWDGHRYLAAASNIVYSSPDAVTWTGPTPDPTDPEPVIAHMAWTGSQYVTVGNRLEGPNDLRGYAYTSSDAIHWQPHELGASDYLYDLAWTGSRLIACGRSGVLWTSANGSSWQALASGTEHPLLAIVVGGGRALVVGGNRTVLRSP